MRSTFAGFTTAELALRAAQTGLNVTGQNISNINTTGYTRQVVDQVSLNTSTSDRYSSSVNAGYGVLVKGINQVRDPYLDIRFRNEVAGVGAADETLSTLNDLQNLLDESKKDGIQTQLSTLSSMLQKLSGSTGTSSYESSVKSSAESLTKLFNQYAKDIETIRSDKEYDLTNVDIPQVNEILKNITELNKSIKSSQVNGNDALELMDQRNVLIDKLATYVNIDVTYVPEKLSESVTLDNLKIDLVGNNNTINLINDTTSSTLEVKADSDGKKQLNILDSAGNPVKDSLGNVIGKDVYNELKGGSIKSSLEMLNCSGVFDGNDNAPRGIGYYEKMLDLMASKFASTFNDLNNSALPAGTPEADLHNLFAASSGSTITAKNITLASGWSNNSYGLTKTTSTDTSATGANDVVNKMINALSTKQSFIDPGSDPSSPSDDINIFTGSFTEFYSNLNTTLGIDVKTVGQTLDNHQAVADEISNSKSGISGVDSSEEGINLIKYQKSFTAAARLMTTMDECLETLIKNTGIAGR